MPFRGLKISKTFSELHIVLREGLWLFYNSWLYLMKVIEIFVIARDYPAKFFYEKSLQDYKQL